MKTYKQLEDENDILVKVVEGTDISREALLKENTELKEDIDILRQALQEHGEQNAMKNK